MHVIQLIPSLNEGGTERGVVDLNREFVRRGIQNTVISAGGKLVPQIVEQGGRHFVCDVKSKNPLTFPLRVFKLRKILRDLSPDILHVLVDGTESRSRKGDGVGSVIDENEASFVNTSDGTWPKEDWYAVTLKEAKTISRVVFMHGKTLNVGGWFDASAGKPRIQIQTKAGGAWEDAGELKDYPATTGDKAGPLKEGESLQCQLAAPVKVFGVRVTGKPSFGGNPNQAFSTCAELQAFAK